MDFSRGPTESLISWRWKGSGTVLKVLALRVRYVISCFLYQLLTPNINKQESTIEGWLPSGGEHRWPAVSLHLRYQCREWHFLFQLSDRPGPRPAPKKNKESVVSSLNLNIAIVSTMSNKQKGPWLFRVYRGLYYPVIVGIIINHCKDSYSLLNKQYTGK